MNTVWRIIQERGGLRPGLSVSIDNEWMRLAIEVLAGPAHTGVWSCRLHTTPTSILI